MSTGVGFYTISGLITTILILYIGNRNLGVRNRQRYKKFLNHYNHKSDLWYVSDVSEPRTYVSSIDSLYWSGLILRVWCTSDNLKMYQIPFFPVFHRNQIPVHPFPIRLFRDVESCRNTFLDFKCRRSRTLQFIIFTPVCWDSPSTSKGLLEPYSYSLKVQSGRLRLPKEVETNDLRFSVSHSFDQKKKGPRRGMDFWFKQTHCGIHRRKGAKRK